MWETHLEWYIADVNLRSQPVVVRMYGKGIAKGGVKVHARAFQIAEDKQLPKCTAWTVSLLCSKARLLCIYFIFISSIPHMPDLLCIGQCYQNTVGPLTFEFLCMESPEIYFLLCS